MRYSLSLLVLILSMAASSAMGAEVDLDAIKSKVEKSLQGKTVTRILPTPIAGLYEAYVGAGLFYVTADGKYAIQGHIVDIEAGLDITTPKLIKARYQAIEDLGEDNMLIFTPEKPTDTITVFTDTGCPYCRKLHEQVPELNKLGVKVRYIFYPLSQRTYDQAIAVWCSDDRNEALTKVKDGDDIELKKCINPVSKHRQLSNEIGVRATPTVYLSNGEVARLESLTAAAIKKAIDDAR